MTGGVTVVIAGFLAACLLAGSAWALAYVRASALKPRIQRVAAPMADDGDAPGIEIAQSVFRTERKRAWLWDRIEAWYPLLQGPRAVGITGGVAAGVGAGLWAVMRLILQVPGGPWLTLGILGGMAASVYGTLVWLQAREAKKFTQQFPDVVDQIAQLSRTGIPPLEALSNVVQDVPPPVQGVLEAVCNGLGAGLDADRTMKTVASRVRIPEFTLFCAVLKLQRKAGGGVSEALGNLTGTLRERRKIALKAHSSTAQTRLTLIVLILLPIVVLAMQKFTAPETVDILFNTPNGLFVLRVGIGLIALGVGVAYLLIARGTR